MSYPPEIYHGESGEVSARLVRGDSEPALVYPNGNKVFYLAQGVATEGKFGLYRWDFKGPPSGPDPHFHRSISESFYVLEGSVKLYDGTDWVTAKAGDFLHVPEGGIHGFLGRDRARMLLMFTPGAPREDYFETLADAARREAMGEDDWTEFFLRHDTFWVDDQ